MIKGRIVRATAAAVTSLGLVTGLAGIAGASTGNISGSGTGSSNYVSSHNRTTTRVDNDNDVRATNNNPQWSSTGRAGVYHNTTGGSATSGMAANTSTLRATVSLSNAGSAGSGSSATMSNTGTITNSGTDSRNVVRSTNTSYTNIDNDNDVTITNNNWQAASSGSATVAGNTTGGNATSGNAVNTSTTELNLSVKN